jgi:hypothetical protein
MPVAARAANVVEHNADRPLGIAALHSQIKIDDRAASAGSETAVTELLRPAPDAICSGDRFNLSFPLLPGVVANWSSIYRRPVWSQVFNAKAERVVLPRDCASQRCRVKFRSELIVEVLSVPQHGLEEAPRPGQPAKRQT